MNNQQLSGDPTSRDGCNHTHAHATIRALLPELAMARILGQPPDEEQRALEERVAACEPCRRELDDLLELLRASYDGSLAPGLDMPTDGLPPPPWEQEESRLVALVIRSVEAAGRMVIRFNEQLLAAMRRPSPAGGFRQGQPPAGDGAPPGEYSYQHQSEPDGLAVAIDFTLTDHERALYRVRITVLDQDDDPFAQEGHRVMVSYEGFSAEQVSDSSGEVTFRDVPLAALGQLQVTIVARR